MDHSALKNFRGDVSAPVERHRPQAGMRRRRPAFGTLYNMLADSFALTRRASSAESSDPSTNSKPPTIASLRQPTPI
jgi:hypothetical protein